MTPDLRLQHVVSAVRRAGLDPLILGGQAVRHYGVDRSTIDFDLYTGAATTDEIRARLAASDLLGHAREGSSWRPGDFVRFEIGRLPDGREEWLEFWLHNHLLRPFAEVSPDRETDRSTGLDYIGLADLLRSKETERERDWLDVDKLEEIADDRAFANAVTPDRVVTALANLRSRRGFDRAGDDGHFADRAAVEAAVRATAHPVSLAYLLPLAPSIVPAAAVMAAIEPSLLAGLRAVAFGTSKHLLLPELVRRSYRRRAIRIDRDDKRSRVK